MVFDLGVGRMGLNRRDALLRGGLDSYPCVAAMISPFGAWRWKPELSGVAIADLKLGDHAFPLAPELSGITLLSASNVLPNLR
jgi:hypothetical protein